jgi:long-chain fatty acid transport protein
MKTRTQKAGFVLATVVLGVIGSTKPSWASGFAILEQGVKGLGNAFSEGATTADDATAIFYNPAGLTQVSGTSIVTGASLIAPAVEFSNRGSSQFGAPLRGGDSGEFAPNRIVPNFYAAWDLGGTVKAGIGVNSPFALATEYPQGWIGRYQALRSSLLTININPTIAAKISRDFSIGAGLNIQYADAKLSNAIDFGTIGRQFGLPTAPQSLDGLVDVQGQDWSLGFNLGVLYAPSRDTRIGLAYRSSIKHELEGKAAFTVPAGAAALTRGGQFTNTSASAELDLPETISLSAYQRVSPKVAISGDVTWTNWSRFRELRIDFDNPRQPDVVQPENWKDTVRVALGVNYDVNPALTLRAGVAYDPTPVRDEFRTARIPDGNRTWVSIGASYRPSPSLTLDVGYSHLFIPDVPIDEAGSTGDRLVGRYNAQVNIIGVQAVWKF